MWPALVFLLLICLVLLDFIWHERRLRLERSRAAREYTEAALKEKEKAFAQAEAQKEALFNSMVEGVLLLGEEGRIDLVNRSLARLFQLNSDIRGQTVLEAFGWPSLDQLVSLTSKEKQVLGSELEFPGEPPCTVQVNAAVYLDQSGRQQGTILVFHDITRLKQLERSRQEFVANVSHELRTPLSLIKGFVETLLSGVREDHALSIRFLQIIAKHTDRLSFLIEDLLTLSKLESGPISLHLQRVELRQVTDRTFDDLRSLAEEKQIALENRIPEDSTVSADGDRLQQVLFNLIENAIKYGKAAGKVIVTARTLENGPVEVSVGDDGPGIPPDACEHVFERFYRVDKARSRDKGGTGLGLAIVKHIVQAHGGGVRVESPPGGGATFFFTLPPSTEAR